MRVCIIFRNFAEGSRFAFYFPEGNFHMTIQQRKKQLHRRLTIVGIVLLAAVAIIVAAAIVHGHVSGSGGQTSSEKSSVSGTEIQKAGSLNAVSGNAAASAPSAAQSNSESGASSAPAPTSALTNASDANYQKELRSFLEDPDGFYAGGPEISRQDLTINPYSRPGEPMWRVDDIVVHSTDSPGATAQNVRDYFESLSDGSRSASSHFVVGLDGEIIQCIPFNEKSYATRWRNYDTISIECCIPGEDGSFNQATYDSCVQLVAWLEYKLGLTASHVIRHYDVTGKNCPRYFVTNEDAWTQFKADVEAEYNTISANGGTVTQ